MAKTMFEKLWEAHVVEHLDEDTDLIYIDRCYVHDLGGGAALSQVKKAGLKPRHPSKVFCSTDHTVLSRPGRTEATGIYSRNLVRPFYEIASEMGVQMFGLENPNQGIIHTIGPELGLSLPGMTIVCGDSHTCTHGALGAMAWGIGTTELYHVLATQVLPMKRPKKMRISIDGKLPIGTEAMDVALYLLGQYGTSAGAGYALEFSGSTIRTMSIEDRATLCNLSVELGAQICMIAPDDVTIEYIKGRAYAPAGDDWNAFLVYIGDIAGDLDAIFDKELTVDASKITPQITWGINPGQSIPIDGTIPATAGGMNWKLSENDFNKAIEYTGLKPGSSLLGTQVDRVFIGSCANGRLSNLEKAAAVVKGKKVARGVEAWAVPGSQAVKRAAEAAGLDIIFKEAGFIWGEPCCALCGASNGETVASGARCISTTNRNFVGRQGPGSRTNLASPTNAALAAISGKIADIREVKEDDYEKV